MARRLTYLQTIRKIHLVLSMFLLIMVSFYLITGYMMAHHQWFKQGKMVETTRTVELTIPFDTVHQSSYIRQIKKEYNISGRTSEFSKVGENKWRASVERPGVWNELTFDVKNDSLFIKTRANESFLRKANRMHHIILYHGGPVYVIWGILVDLTILGFFIFAITGLLIWIKMRKVFKWGLYILIPVSVFTLVVIMYILVW